ncbi:hypothetical protein PHK61_30425 [Actinomycetospora lutea]|uniref:hypothetical protein n=1 Tax=Actinomycetospora lutea TaxID=663604 RepID=UPI002366040F|nr:hypothetical protein [Actinomycetospora lutea]MDD7942739.1 hypothetical protein [Actinomycetospora lutea]
MGVLAAVGALGVSAGAWAVTPLVSMARRGTRDQQTVESWREETDRAAAVQRARRRAAIVASVPIQRSRSVDVPATPQQRRSPLAS